MNNMTNYVKIPVGQQRSVSLPLKVLALVRADNLICAPTHHLTLAANIDLIGVNWRLSLTQVAKGR